jgi:hypothetical protein
VGILLGVGAMLRMRRTAFPRVRGRQSAVAAQPVADGNLDIPLDQTLLARQEFLDAYKNIDRRHARSLYEEFLPRVGANGLRTAIQEKYPSCHDEGHELGQVIFAKLRDVGQALESCADACASGCMHGVLMEFFTDTTGSGAGGQRPAHVHSMQLTAEDVAKRIPTICESSAFTRMYRPGDCAHGVGHAVMFLSKYDRPAAIDLCEKFPSYALRYYCATGAYMEYRITRSSSDFLSHGPLYPCDQALYPAACFRYVLTSSAPEMYARGGKLGDLIRLCAGLTGKYRLGCFHGVGNAHMGLVATGRMSLADVCSAGSRDDRTVCVEGAMERLGKFSPTVASQRCSSLTDWRQAVCSAAAGRKMYDMEKSFALYQR